MPRAAKSRDDAYRARALIIAWAIGSLIALAIALALLTLDDAPSAGAANLRRLWPYWIASASGFGALTGLWLLLRSRPGSFAGERFGRAAMLILAVGLGARVAALLTHEPALSDDVYRYVFDGRNGAAGVNPYLPSPEERMRTVAPIPVAEDVRAYAERWAGESLVVELINNPELHTIYLPTSQWIFALTGLIAPEAAAEPEAAARLFRGVFVLIELAAMGLLLLALRSTRRSAWWLALYAWHPLPITEIAGSGHQDIIGIALMLAALVLYTSSPVKIARFIGALAPAVLVKPIVLPIAAILLRRRPWSAWLKALLIGAAICAAIAAPLILTHGGEPLENLRQTVQRFSLKWAHFGSVYKPLLATIETVTPEWTNDGQERLARGICIALLGTVILGVFLRGRSAWRDCAWILLAMVLLSPAAHPWYLLWALILVPVAASPTVWVASLTLPWGYAALADPEGWTVPAWLMLASYVPIYATLVIELIRHWRDRDPADGEPS